MRTPTKRLTVRALSRAVSPSLLPIIAFDSATSLAPRTANKRLSRNSKGKVVLQLKSPCRDGTTHIVIVAQELMQRLAALVHRSQLHTRRQRASLGREQRFAMLAETRRRIFSARQRSAFRNPTERTWPEQ